MKTFLIENNRIKGNEQAAQLVWSFIADSAVTNEGKPFYIPETTSKVEAFLAPVVRISRLGKTISQKFADRYYSEIAPAVHFRLTDLFNQLLSENLPTDMAVSFDRSLIYGEFSPIEKTGIPDFSLFLNDEKAAELSFHSFHESIDGIISKISKINTLKMGDFLIPAISGPVGVTINDILEIKNATGSYLKIKIK